MYLASAARAQARNLSSSGSRQTGSGRGAEVTRLHAPQSSPAQDQDQHRVPAPQAARQRARILQEPPGTPQFQTPDLASARAPDLASLRRTRPKRGHWCRERLSPRADRLYGGGNVRSAETRFTCGPASFGDEGIEFIQRRRGDRLQHNGVGITHDNKPHTRFETHPLTDWLGDYDLPLGRQPRSDDIVHGAILPVRIRPPESASLPSRRPAPASERKYTPLHSSLGPLPDHWGRPSFRCRQVAQS